VPAAVINAIVNALSPSGVVDMMLPVRSEKVWRAPSNHLDQRTCLRDQRDVSIAKGFHPATIDDRLS